jgi:hypothetical protein
VLPPQAASIRRAATAEHARDGRNLFTFVPRSLIKTADCRHYWG